MAAITFNAKHQKGQVREQLGNALAAFREMLDAFVSNRIRQAVAETERVRPRHALRAPSPEKNAT
jgi:hypothetical protein